MSFVILVNAILCLLAALLYYPESPLYLFPGVNLEELWLWSKYAAFMSALLFIFSLLAIDTSIKGRNIARSFSAFVTALQGIFNLPPLVLYLVFLHWFHTSKLTVKAFHITISNRELYFHLAIIVISWSTSAWLAFGRKNREFSKAVLDSEPEPAHQFTGSPIHRPF